MEKLLLSVKEAAEVMGVGRTKAFELLATGKLEGVLIGHRRLIPADAIAAFVERLRADQSGQSSQPDRDEGPLQRAHVNLFTITATSPPQQGERRVQRTAT